MKITFIMPSVGRKKDEAYVKGWMMEPLAVAVLSALTPPGIERVFYDDRLEKIPLHESTDLVAISVETYTARRAYQLSSVYRKRGIPVVMGGFHATLMPDEVAGHADAVVMGEAEEIWARVIQDAQSGSLQPFYKSVSRPSLKGIFPDRAIYKQKKYTNLTLIEAGRGCRYTCDFCSVSSFFKRSYTARPIEDIVREIEMIKAKAVFFVDDNLTMDRPRAIELFQALIPLRIQWVGQASMNIYQDDELLALIKKSGGLGLLVGFESVDPHNIRAMGKDVNKSAACYEEAMRQFRKHRICIYGTFLCGYDHDTESTIRKAYDFALKHKLFYAAFNHVIPFPGTPLYNRLQEEKRLLYRQWWLEENYTFGEIPFHPRHMSAEELSKICYQYRYAFYSFSSALKRSLNLRVNLQNVKAISAYVYLNLTARKETDRRRGLPMGFTDHEA